MPNSIYVPLPVWKETRERIKLQMDSTRRAFHDKSREWETKEQVLGHQVRSDIHRPREQLRMPSAQELDQYNASEAADDAEGEGNISEIKNPDGSIVFRLADIDVPAQFSQVAADILAQKYFRKAGVPKVLKKVEENDVPSFLWRSVADEKALASLPENERYGSETDARQVFDRLAGTWRNIVRMVMLSLSKPATLDEIVDRRSFLNY